MTRLFLATALVLHLSGLPAAAGVVSAVAGADRMTPGACCCHHGAADQGRAPHASPVCPCSMSKDVPPPATSMPATASSSENPLAAIALAALPLVHPVLAAVAYCLHDAGTGDSSPPYLTAAHPRC